MSAFRGATKKRFMWKGRKILVESEYSENPIERTNERQA